MRENKVKQAGTVPAGTQKINVSPSTALRLHRPALSPLITSHGVVEIVDMLQQLRVQMLYHVASAQRGIFFIFNPFLFKILIIIAPNFFFGSNHFGNIVAPHAMARQYPQR